MILSTILDMLGILKTSIKTASPKNSDDVFYILSFINGYTTHNFYCQKYDNLSK